MTIAAKHLDPLVGLDTHIILIPTPAGPVPTPLPHPYVGMLLDPMDYVPIMGATVYINGLPRGVAGSNGKALPPHIPMGGPFAKPPTNESEIFMGSATVLSDGDPQSFLGLPVLSCQDIGMPPPPRPKKKSVAKTLLLPTTVILCIPMGGLVLVGGPPTISMMAIAQKLGLGALKKFRKGKLMRKLSDKIHKLANKLCDKLKIGKRARALIHKAICTVTGHPVDVATGKVFTDAIDFELPGAIPFVWERTWYSTSTYAGPLGHGWHHSYDQTLYVDDGVILYQAADGRHIGLPAIKIGGSYFHRGEKLTFSRDDIGYAIQHASGLVSRFVAVAGRPRTNVPLVQLDDGLGNVLRLHYDAFGRLARIVDCAQRTIDVAYDASGRIAALSAPHPDVVGQTVYVTRYEYDGWGNLVAARDALGQPVSFAYQQHLLVKETNRVGFSYYFQYDAADSTAKCLRTWGDGGVYDHKLTYDEDAGITVVENSLGYKTTHHHRGGVVWKTIDALGNVTLMDRNDYAEIERETAPTGAVSSRTFDERGNEIKSVAKDGAVAVRDYDAKDRLVHAVDAVGGEWFWEYDDTDRVTSRKDPLGRTTTYVWIGKNLQAMLDPANQRLTFEYDAHDNLAAITFRDGSRQHWKHDGWGRMIEALDVNGNAERREIDLLDRIVRAHEPDGNTHEFAYDGESNVVAARDRTMDIQLSYSGSGKLVTRAQAGTQVLFSYDTEEQLLTIQNEHGATYQFEHGPTGALIAERGFGGFSKRYRRDAVDRVVEVERSSGIRVKYAYDLADRIVKIEYPNDPPEVYRYRGDGELLEATNGTAVVKFELDVVGNVLKETQGKDWVASEYDLLDQRTRVRSSRGLDLQLSMDSEGRCRELSVQPEGPDVEVGSKPLFKAEFAYDSLGQEIERTFAGGVKARWSRDRLGRPLRQEVWAGATFKGARSLTWDVDERITQIIDAFRGPFGFVHDAMGRLVSTMLPSGQVELRMPDALGRLFKTETRGDRVYGPAGELRESRSELGVTRYEYDPDGNLTRKSQPDGKVWSYSWNAAGMLTRVVRPDGQVVEYAYDALSRRVLKRFRDKATRWIWDANAPLHEWSEAIVPAAVVPLDSIVSSDAAAIAQRDRVLQPRSAQGPPAQEPILGTPDQPITWLLDSASLIPIGRIAGGKSYGIVVDHLGTPTSMFDEAGAEVWSASLDSYGALRDLVGAEQDCPFRWRGQYADSDSGLYYNRLRYYDPDSGAYISQDPLLAEATLEMYTYVPDPNTTTDMFGLGSDPIHHIATNKNSVSPARGGPWTPKFQKIFDAAGVDMDDAMNKLAVPGHKGPHPEEYHQAVLDRLKKATKGKRTEAARRKALKKELDAIKKALRNPNSKLNKLVTKRPCK